MQCKPLLSSFLSTPYSDPRITQSSSLGWRGMGALTFLPGLPGPSYPGTVPCSCCFLLSCRPLLAAPTITMTSALQPRPAHHSGWAELEAPSAGKLPDLSGSPAACLLLVGACLLPLTSPCSILPYLQILGWPLAPSPVPLN